MKQISQVDISFKEVKDGIQYYNVKIDDRQLVIPRYHTFLGWIEIFGLPPQHEWCVLSNIEPFEKSATLQINDKSFNEHIVFNPDPANKRHYIKVRRSSPDGTQREDFTWSEDYTNAPENITNMGIFSHSDGNYSYEANKRGFEWSKYRDVTVDNIIERFPLDNADQERFVKWVVAKNLEQGYDRKPDALWIKTFKAQGVLPPIFYDMFPNPGKLGSVDLTKVQGWICELGYLKKEGEEIDKIHGDWYKLIKINDKFFYIEEDNYTSCEAEIDGKTTRIKDTYRKKLFEYESKT